MKTPNSLQLISISVALTGFTSCSDSGTEIDGRNQESFLESAAALEADLPEVQKELFETSLIHLQRERDFADLDGMSAEEILEAEAIRLKDEKAGRIAKLEKFEDYERKFTNQGGKVPQNIATTLAEVKDDIESIDTKLAALEGRLEGGE